MIKLIAPKVFKNHSTLDFLNQAEIIFKNKGQQKDGFILDLSKIDDISILNLLIIYKMMAYSIENNCFNKPEFEDNEKVKYYLTFFGFTDLFNALVEHDGNEKYLNSSYRKIEIKIKTDQLLIAPQPLLKDIEYSMDYIKNKFYPSIEDFYLKNDRVKSKEKAISLVFNSISEILSNFWQDATETANSILIAHASADFIRIACVDNGKGIISSLRQLYGNKDGIKIIESCVKLNITCKSSPYNMGHGLWLLDNFATNNRGNLSIFSEGHYYDNKSGKIKTGVCGFWQGTILYLDVSLNNPITASDLYNNMVKDSEVLINFN